MDGKSEYAAKFKDPRWQRKRLQILERDEFTCQRCFDSESTLHVHHLYYVDADPWGYPDKALITLCEGCHEYETLNLRDMAGDLVQMLKQCGAMTGEFEDLCRAMVSGTGEGRRLDEYDWSLIAFCLEEIVSGCFTRSDVWAAANDRFNRRCAERAAAKRDKAGEE